MKIIIFTYDRYDTITTSKYFKDIPHTVLCHSVEAEEKFLNAGRIYGGLIATQQPKGLANNRNFALNMLEEGEWACFFVDDLIDMTYLKDYQHYEKEGRLNVTSQNQPQFRQDFKELCSPEQFLKICEETIQEAEKHKFTLCGFSLTNNAMFRDRHYSYWSLADGRCWLVKKTKLRFDTNVQLIDDTCFTALNLKTFGGVVVNNWLLPECLRYTAGAYGTLDQRMEQKLKECKYLVETYPEFVAIAEKVGWETGSHVKIRQRKVVKEQQSLF